MKNINIRDFESFSMAGYFAGIDSIAEHLSEVFPKNNLRMTVLDDLDFQLIDLGSPKYNPPISKAIIYSPIATPGRTVLLTNLRDGWASLAIRLGNVVGCDCIRINTTRADVEYPLNRFAVMRDGVDIRYVHSMLDSDKWVFFEEGEVQPFEDAKQYKKRKIRDRLTRDLVFEYFSRMGFDIENEDLWRTREMVLCLE